MLVFLKEYWFFMIFVTIISVLMFFFRQQRIVKEIIYSGVLEAEEFIGSKKGEEKLKYVCDMLRNEILSKLWFPLDKISKFFFTEKRVKKYINNVLDKLEGYFHVNNENKKIAMESVVDKLSLELKNIKFGDNPELCSNSQIEEVSQKLKSEITDKNTGFVEAFADYEMKRGDVDSTEIKAGVRAGYKF